MADHERKKSKSRKKKSNKKSKVSRTRDDVLDYYKSTAPKTSTVDDNSIIDRENEWLQNTTVPSENDSDSEYEVVDVSLSPPRRRPRNDSTSSSGSISNDLCPPRRRQRADSSSTNDTDTKNRSGKKVTEESQLGQGASTVYRDEDGKKINMLQQHLQSKEQKQHDKVIEATMKYEWGKGAADKQKARDQDEEFQDIKNSSFAVYANDTKLNTVQKRMIRSGDPMAKFLRCQTPVEEVTTTGKPVYKGPPPPINRFNVKPGHRWDGIDRSNGFEKRLLARGAIKEHIKGENHKWSTQDM